MKKQYKLGVLAADDDELKPLRDLGIRVTMTNGSQDNTEIICQLNDDTARKLLGINDAVLSVQEANYKDVRSAGIDLYGPDYGCQRIVDAHGTVDTPQSQMEVEFPHGQFVRISDGSAYWIWDQRES